MIFNHITDRRFMIIGVFPKYADNDSMLSELEEIESLIKTYGSRVYALSVQKANFPSLFGYLRKGKAQEVSEIINKEKIDIVVAKDILKHKQLNTLENQFKQINPDIQVWDKVYLILHIFDQFAQTHEANLQIKIAGLKHLGHKLMGMGSILSRQGGGIGTRGIGETNTEIMKRHWRDEIRQTSHKIKELEKNRHIQIARRKKTGALTVSLVGYTNAGKTTLFNKLTGKSGKVENKLFTTLDSEFGRLYLPEIKADILISDTIGFIKNLPPSLISAFKSTLLQTNYSDLILHLIDISDRTMENKIEAVNVVLRDIKADKINRLYVFNKIDQAHNNDRQSLKLKYSNYSPVFISSLTGEGIKNLLNMISVKIKSDLSDKQYPI